MTTPTHESDAPAPAVPLWATEAADEMEEAILVCDSLLPPAHLIYKGFNKEVAAAIIAAHAPQPIYTGPCSPHYEKLTKEVLDLRKHAPKPAPNVGALVDQVMTAMSNADANDRCSYREMAEAAIAAMAQEREGVP